MDNNPAVTTQTKIPVVLGILSLIFGALQAVYALITTVMTWLFTGMATSLVNTFQGATGAGGEAERIFKLVNQAIEVTKPYTLMLNLSTLVMASALIVVGWGLYNRSWWGRQATLAWCGAAFLVIVLRVALTKIMTAKVLAIVGAMLETPALKAQLEAQSLPLADGNASLIVSSVLLAIYPTVLAAMIGRAAAQAEFSVKPGA